MRYLFILFALSAAATAHAQLPQLLKDIYPGTSSGYPSTSATLVLVNNNLFFSGIDSAHGKEPWVSDGTTAGTYMLKDMVPGTASSIGINSPFYYNSKYFFSGSDDSLAGELFTTDLTAPGTSFMADFFPGVVGSTPSLIAVLNGVALIGAADTFLNSENMVRLYTSDGTIANTQHMMPGLFYRGKGIVMNNKMYFPATTLPYYDDRELWITDGTAAGTTLVKDINPGLLSSSLRGFTKLNDTQFLFTATEPTHGRELWISDGTSAGTYMLKDVYPGMNSGSPTSLYNWNGKVYFRADYNGLGLWVSDGTSDGTYKIEVDSLHNPGSFVAVNGKLLFQADDFAHGYELWSTDGTDSGTAMLMDINPADLIGSQLDITGQAIIGNTLYFTAIDGTHGREIWRTDGDTVYLFHDMNPGTASGLPQFAKLVAKNNRIFFPGNDGTAGTEVYYFDAENTSVPEINKTFASTIYPNPTSGVVNIIADMHQATITTRNLLGQVIDNRSNISGKNYSIDISQQPAGIYIIEVFSEGMQSRHKVVKE